MSGFRGAFGAWGAGSFGAALRLLHASRNTRQAKIKSGFCTEITEETCWFASVNAVCLEGEPSFQSPGCRADMGTSGMLTREGMAGVL